MDSNEILLLEKIIDGYETQLCLNAPECEIGAHEPLLNKIKLAELVLAKKDSEGKLSEKEFLLMMREFDRLNLRLSFLMCDLKAKKKIILVPSKRRFLYMGEEVLFRVFNDLIYYDKIKDQIILKESLDHVIKSLKEAKGDCENHLEFRLLLILAMFLFNFPTDIQTISFISQLFLNQSELQNLIR